MEWISVEDRLPPARKKVLIAYNRGVSIAERNGYLVDPTKTEPYWRGVHGPKHSLRSVTHWMPLPDPPEKEKSNGKL